MRNPLTKYYPLMAGEPDTESDKEECSRFNQDRLLDAGSSAVTGFTFLEKFLTLVILAQVLLLLFLQSRSNTSRLSLYSPAQSVLEDEIKVFADGLTRKTRTIFQDVSDESDQAWENLYNQTMMKITRKEAELLPNRTWPIKNEPGYYIAQVDVFHQLHCLNMIRQAFHKERYGFDKLAFKEIHMSHCIDSIRQYMMCNADVSVIFWQWDDVESSVRPRFDYPHMCRNFDRLREWARDRHIEQYIDDKVYIENDLPTPPILY